MTDAIKLTNAERMETGHGERTAETDRAGRCPTSAADLAVGRGAIRGDEVSERIECSRGFVASWNKTIRRTADRGGSTAGIWGQVALGAYTGARSADPGGDAPCAGRWSDALEYAQNSGAHLGHQPHDGGTSVAQARPEAASDRALYGLETIRISRRRRADIIGLYLNPPAHAAVFCVDEKNGHSSPGS